MVERHRCFSPRLTCASFSRLAHQMRSVPWGSEVAKTPDPIDVHVGARIRIARLQHGLSQEKLADAMSITFQQVQKYEKGTNRISPSRLSVVARTLGMPMQEFFRDAPSEPLTRDDDDLEAVAISHFVSTREGIELNRAFAKLKATRRRNVLNLVRSMAGTDAD